MRATSFEGTPLLNRVCHAMSLSTESKALVRSSMHRYSVLCLLYADSHNRTCKDLHVTLVSLSLELRARCPRHQQGKKQDNNDYWTPQQHQPDALQAVAQLSPDGLM